MIEIVVGSKNPTKLKATELAAAKLWDEEVKITGVAVESGVSDQPFRDNEMIKGAITRAGNAISQLPSAKYSIGMEGGVRDLPEAWFNLGWVCVMDVASRQVGLGVTVAHEIPEPVSNLMEFEGLELSDAVAQIYKTDTATDRDCSGVITDGLLPADELYAGGIISAFAALKNNLTVPNLDKKH